MGRHSESKGRKIKTKIPKEQWPSGRLWLSFLFLLSEVPLRPDAHFSLKRSIEALVCLQLDAKGIFHGLNSLRMVGIKQQRREKLKRGVMKRKYARNLVEERKSMAKQTTATSQ